MRAQSPEAAPAPLRDRGGFGSDWPRRTIRARLALFYFGAFLVSGIILLVATVALWQGGSSTSVARAPQGGAGGLAVPRAAPPQVAQHSADLHHLLVAAATALVLLAVLSIAFGWFAAGRFLQPLRLITTTTREISANNLNERLRLNGPEDEIKELGDTFDALLERLERSFEAERRFAANASHELRTPLATMRASLDVAMAKPGPVPPQTAVLADRLRRELDHVDNLLASLLTLHKPNERRPPTRPPSRSTSSPAPLSSSGPGRSRTWDCALTKNAAPMRGRSAARLCFHGWWTTWWRMRSSTTSGGVGSKYKPPLTVRSCASSLRTVERSFNLKTSANWHGLSSASARSGPVLNEATAWGCRSSRP